MEKKIIAFANQKGGVGKTTVSFNFAVSLANRGYKVLLVDLDSQGNLTKYFGIPKPNELTYTIGHAIEHVIKYDEMNFTEEFRLCSNKRFENLMILPANNYLYDLKPMMLQATARESILDEILDPLKRAFDYIVIDCAPSLDIDLINALVAADEVLIVSTPDVFSYDGSEQLMKSIIKVMKRLNPELEMAGVICNMVDNRNKFMPAMIQAMRENWEKRGVARVFKTEIPKSVRVAESQFQKEPMLIYEANNAVTQACERLVDEYLELERKGE